MQKEENKIGEIDIKLKCNIFKKSLKKKANTSSTMKNNISFNKDSEIQIINPNQTKSKFISKKNNFYFFMFF